MNIKFVIIFLLSLFVFACGTTGTPQNGKIIVSNNSNRPTWTKNYNKKDICGTAFCFVGHSYGNSYEAEAEDSATINAFGTIARILGVEVHSSLEAIRQEENGEYNYMIKYRDNLIAKPIKIRGWYSEGFSHIEHGNGKYNAWVRIAIPKEEFERINKELDEQEKYSKIKAKALTAWALESNFREECGGKIKDLFSFLKEKKGLNIVEQEEDFDSAEEIAKRHPDYAYFLKIECNNVGENDYSDKTKFYYIDLKVELYNLITGSIDGNWSQDQVKGAKIKVGNVWRYGKQGGASDAVLEAIKKIRDQIDESY